MKPITILTGSSGLNNNADPAHLRTSSDGKVYLSSCNNIVIGDTGRIDRVLGKSLISSTATDSLYSCGIYGYCVQNGYICSLQSENITPLFTISGSSIVDYERIFDGEKNVIFYTNGTQKGRIIKNIGHTWVKGDYLGPTTTKVFVDPPNGHFLMWACGRMFVAQDNNLYGSLPGNPYLFDLNRGRFSYDDEIQMVAGNPNSFWVSDKKRIYFAESDGKNWRQRIIADFPALKGKPVKIDSGTLPFQGLTGYGYICPTVNGFCFLGQDGTFINMTQRNIELRGTDRKYLPFAEKYALTYARNRAYFSNGDWSLILNAINLSTTQTNLYNAGSYATIDETVYGASTSGLFKETVTNDFESELTFHFDTQNLCHMRFLYLYGELTDDVEITLTGDQNISVVYTVEPRLGSRKQHEIKIPISRTNGIARYWTIKIRNLNGIDFSIDRIEAYPFFRAIYRGK